MLRIGLSEGWLPDGVPYIRMLYPFWGIPKSDQNATLKRFDEFHDEASAFLRLTSVRESDVAVLPFDWKHALRDVRARAAAEDAAEEAERAGRRIIVFFFADSEAEVPLENALVFRTSMQRGLRSNEFAFPAWIHDYVGTALNGLVPVRPKWTRPTVGFCGFAGYRLIPDTSLYRRWRARARIIYRRFPAMTVRERAIRSLRTDSGIETNFLLRDNFYAGALDSNNPQLLEAAEQAYVNNLIGSDYIMCARGGGNFSYRFYETLAMGRIPLFIDTNCALPYNWEIDYGSYGLFVDEERLDTVTDALVRYHDELHPSDFIELQHRCRSLWSERLSPLGFFRHFHKHLELVT